MSISFPDELAGTFQKPLIPLGEAVGAVRSLALAGSTLTLTLVSATDKTGDRAIPINLPSGGSGGLYAVARYRRTTSSGTPSAPTSNSDADWSADYTAADQTNAYSWLALKIGTGSDPDDATGWQILPVDSPEASGVSGVSSIGAGTGIAVNRATGAVTVSVDDTLANIRGALSSVGTDDLSGTDGGVLAVQTSEVNLSIANGYSYTGEGGFSAYNLAAQTADPWVLVGISAGKESEIARIAVRHGGADGDLTPDLADGWNDIGKGTVGTARNYRFYRRQFTGYTWDAGAVTLEETGQIDDRFIPRSVIDDEVEDYALRGRTERVDLDRLPEASTSQGGVITAAQYNRIAAAIQNDDLDATLLTASQIEGGDAVLLRDGSVTTGNELAEITFTELDKRWYGQTAARSEVLDEYFTSEGWQNSTTGQILTLNNEVRTTAGASSGDILSLALLRSGDYSATPDDVSPRETDRWIYWKAPIAADGSGAWRVQLDLDGEAGSDPQQIVFDETLDANFVRVGTSADGTEVFYRRRVANLPVGATLRIQQYDHAALNRERVDVNDIFPDPTGRRDGDILTLTDAEANTRGWRSPRHAGGGLRLLLDNSAGGRQIAVGSSDYEGTTVAPTPDFDMTDETGVLFFDVRWVISGRNDDTINFVRGISSGNTGDAIYEREYQAEVHVPRILAQSAYIRGGAREGLRLPSTQVTIHSGSADIGVVEAWVAKEADTDNLVCYWYYDGLNGSALSYTLTAYWTVSYLPLGGAAAGGGAARTAPVTLVDATMDEDFDNANRFQELPVGFAFSRALAAADDDKYLVMEFAYDSGPVPNGETAATLTTEPMSTPLWVKVSDWRALTAKADSTADDGADADGWFIGTQRVNRARDAWTRAVFGKGTNGRPGFSFASSGTLKRLRIRLVTVG